MIRSISAFAHARWLAHTLKSRGDVERWQAVRLARLVDQTLPHMPFYRDFGVQTFASLPVIDKSVLMAQFDAFNRIGLGTEEGWEIISGRAAQRPGFSVGASTGTSGNRGLYVISAAEREVWLGTILAKTLPAFPLETAKVALVLPLNSSLYTTAARSSRLELRFFDLHAGLESLLPEIDTYRPDTVIAPPKVLKALALSGTHLKLKRLFSGAEVLDPEDRAVIEGHLLVPVREIYMATEGLLAVSCPHGTLHLCEDVVHFEWERPVPDSDLVTPVITDFTRTTQALCRYRMNDLLRLSQTPCACGSPFQAVAEVIGRCDDVIEIGRRSLTPDILRNAIIDADRRINDFRLRQTGPAHLELILAIDLPPEAVERARHALSQLLGRLGARAKVHVTQAPLGVSAAKLRRVERVWRP